MTVALDGAPMRHGGVVLANVAQHMTAQPRELATCANGLVFQRPRAPPRDERRDECAKASADPDRNRSDARSAGKPGRWARCAYSCVFPDGLRRW